MTEALILAVVVQSLVIAFLAGTVPFLWWKAFSQEDKIRVLDETLAHLCEVAGLGKKEEDK